MGGLGLVMTKPRIYVSVMPDWHLNADQISFKAEVIKAIHNKGFMTEIVSYAEGTPWNIHTANEKMSHCHGAAILAFAKWRNVILNGKYYDLPSAYNQFDGALAVANGVPILVITDRNVMTGGINLYAQGLMSCYSPIDGGAEWLTKPGSSFNNTIDSWSKLVISRRNVFLGYCSKAKKTAESLKKFIEEKLNINVIEYSMDFAPGETVIDQIDYAINQSTCGIFLFTKDEQIPGDENQAAPRDNVIFETGLFRRAKGKNKVLIIREQGTKMPTDMGGIIYQTLGDRDDIREIERPVVDFLEKQL